MNSSLRIGNVPFAMNRSGNCLAVLAIISFAQPVIFKAIAAAEEAAEGKKNNTTA